MKHLIVAYTFELAIMIIAISVIINLLLHRKWTKITIEKIIDDTLKVNDGPIRRFSGTKITMLVAFGSVLWAFHYTTLRGFNEFAFGTMALIATGVSLTGAWSKKINPPTESTEETPKAETA